MGSVNEKRTKILTCLGALLMERVIGIEQKEVYFGEWMGYDNVHMNVDFVVGI